MNEGHWAQNMSSESDSRADLAQTSFVKLRHFKLFPRQIKIFLQENATCQSFLTHLCLYLLSLHK